MGSPHRDRTTHQAAGAGDEAPRRLFRSREGRMIAGVCDGIATSFAIDVLIVRVAVVALVLAGGVGLAAYAAAWLLVPLSPVAGAPSASPAPPPPVRVFNLVDELPLVSARR